MMEFRPCIDIHNGKVKQIEGATLKDEGDSARENFTSDRKAAYFASLYKKDSLKGAHVIMLNPEGSRYRKQTEDEAISALSHFPGGLEVGGGINDVNAPFFLDRGASHVIVTSFVFRDGKIDYERLRKLEKSVGKKHIVLDLSCRKVDGHYLVATDRWQKLTKEKVNTSLLNKLEKYADEYLVHGVSAEGKRGGIDEGLVKVLSEYDGISVTYAGGIRDFSDIEMIEKLGKGRINFTVGSALDFFGGSLSYEEIVKKYGR